MILFYILYFIIYIRLGFFLIQTKAQGFGPEHACYRIVIWFSLPGGTAFQARDGTIGLKRRQLALVGHCSRGFAGMVVLGPNNGANSD